MNEELDRLRRQLEKWKPFEDYLEKCKNAKLKAQLKSQAKQDDGEWSNGDNYWTINGCLNISGPYIMDTTYAIARLGFLNCFKTKEQAEVARYCLIHLFYLLKEYGSTSNHLGSTSVLPSEGKRIAQELGLDN